MANFLRLENRLKSNASLTTDYVKFMTEYESLQHMERITDSATLNDSLYYIPHHAMIRKHSTTTKLRVVFNASAKSTNGKSLNDLLLPWPKLQLELTAILLRWRQFSFALAADIAKMYRQILIHADDTNYQRILWRSSPESEINEYRLNTVTYGTASAPFLALRVIKQLAQDDGHKFPLAVPVLLDQTYVDDCLFGAYDLQTALSIRDQTLALLKQGGFHLRKWITNDSNLLANIDPSDYGIAHFDFQLDESVKILGLSWRPERDAFQFHIQTQNSSVVTKRQVLSVIARLYDPLGWLSPIVIMAKTFMQKLWSTTYGWNDELSKELCREWISFLRQLPAIESILIPRWTGYNPKLSHVEIHGFSDASTKAYAAVVYLRVVSPSGLSQVTPLMSKSKVAPIKTVSVPRLELCAAELLSRLINFVRTELKLQDNQCFCWSDSTVTLAWLRHSPSKWKTFVANRVASIQTLLENVTWKYVPTADNPADCASRGILPTDLPKHSQWWTGPAWLSQSSEFWPHAPPISNKNDGTESLEVRAVHQVIVIPQWDLPTRFSSWTKLLRITALIRRFIDRLRKQPISGPTLSTLGPSDLEQSRNLWIKSIQAELFPSEIKALRNSAFVASSSLLSSLSPFIDANGILRARGRLRHAQL